MKRWLCLGILLVAGRTAEAHMLVRVGNLIDLTQRSQQIVVGTVEKPPMGPAGAPAEITLATPSFLVGTGADSVRFLTRTRPEKGGRYVFFLSVQDGTVSSLQEAGSLFASGVADDPSYRAAVVGIRQALLLPEAGRVPGLRRVLVHALESDADALRYHAALELIGLNHDDHPLSDADRAEVERISRAPGLDPNLRPLLTRMLARPALP